jgi:hypothetical protein
MGSRNILSGMTVVFFLQILDGYLSALKRSKYDPLNIISKKGRIIDKSFIGKAKLLTVLFPNCTRFGQTISRGTVSFNIRAIALIRHFNSYWQIGGQRPFASYTRPRLSVEVYR